MYPLLSSLFLFVCGFLTLIGLIFNGFVVIINCIWWLQCKKIQTVDIIITSLGLARFFLLVTEIFNVNFLILIPLESKTKPIAETFLALSEFLTFCSIWFATLLCVFYCVKITSYNYRLFIYVKLNISSMFPWLYLVSVAASFITSVPSLLSALQFHIVYFTNDFSNTSEEEIHVNINMIDQFATDIIGSSLPLPIFCLAISLLIRSLWNHTRNMTSKDSGFHNPDIEAHFSAVKNLLSFLFFHILYFVAVNLWSFVIETKSEMWLSVLYIVYMAYPSLHTVILIFSNIKLKQALVSLSFK
ncbi:taste receptor type 2 member 40-like [Bombina bombina]|uniref:taste receptor type 2 member 40-like n=1 Tax=Bombina bombina TaxID=8345 RepID=UPI00235A93F8|nr:taste receptor type 2 member 40-like [Bombina bombina]